MNLFLLGLLAEDEGRYLLVEPSVPVGKLKQPNISIRTSDSLDLKVTVPLADFNGFLRDGYFEWFGPIESGRLTYRLTDKGRQAASV